MGRTRHLDLRLIAPLVVVVTAVGGITWGVWPKPVVRPLRSVAWAIDIDVTLRDPSTDPLAIARSQTHVANLEAAVPPQCYTKTDGRFNPCFACHTRSRPDNPRGDEDLQRQYSFSDVALTNHWTNLFADRSSAIAAISDAEILAWVREDDWSPLVEALDGRRDYAGWCPDLDFAMGFDDEGFARDGSGWRAVRYKPFPGAFWPTNGSTDDLFVRLPVPLRGGQATKADARAIHRVNFAILEAAITADPRVATADLVREVGPVDEGAGGVDLDGDGLISPNVTEIRGLPRAYASRGSELVERYRYPTGTELLHTVRYLDPDAPTLAARRMKEVRYMKKTRSLDRWATVRANEREADEKDEGRLPIYPGSPEVGYANAFGWQLQGFIEDVRGRLRAQTAEEHRYCMGCHSSVGVTVDQTFSFARKVPGADGWRLQDIRGIPDVPQVGHADPEALMYFRRVGGGDELRANDEILARFFPRGRLDETSVRRAQPGGDRDLAWLLAPSRERALALDKAYLVIVREQSFVKGRDAVIRAAKNVHERIRNGSTDLATAKRVHLDGSAHLDWSGVDVARERSARVGRSARRSVSSRGDITEVVELVDRARVQPVGAELH